MITSMGIVLQIFFRCVVNCIKLTLKLKVKMILDSHHMAISSCKHNSYNDEPDTLRIIAAKKSPKFPPL